MGKSLTRKNTTLEGLLTDAYFNPKKSTSYGGKSQLQNITKNYKKVSKQKIEQWLQSQDAYTLHKTARKRFPRRPTIVGGYGEQVQADLIDMQKFKSENDGYSFILTVIDVFSKFAWTCGVKSKTGSAMATALTKIFDQTKYRYLQTDKGKEFYNAKVKSVLEIKNITHFSTENDDIKASIVERFNRSIQNRLHRWFTKSKARRWVDVLSDMTEAYNNTYHRSIKMKPVEVTRKNSEDVWLNLYGNLQYTNKTSRIKMNDAVRISRFKHVFSKGYDKNWSTEVFFVNQVMQTSPITFILRDQLGEKIAGTYYYHELQKVAVPEEFEIEEILKTRKSKGKIQYLVKYKGYPSKFNQWIDKTQLV